MATFRRSGSIIDDTGRVFKLRPAEATEASRAWTWTLGLPQAKLGKCDYPDKGDEVFLVVEIMLNGQKHPTPWARLADIAAWSDHNLAAGVALRVEWFNGKSGQWMSMYHQHLRLLSIGQQEASPERYSQAMAPRRYFLRQTIPDFDETWQIDIGKLARVKKITFDNLEQVFLATNLIDSSKGPKPTRIPDAVIIQQLKQAGAQNVNHPWPVQGAPKVKFGQGSRNTCDSCQINGNKPCLRAGGQHRCQFCYHYGILCSWTPTKAIPPQLRQLLGFKEANNDGPTEIPDPQLRRGTV
jgi:hypothetical protein